jgi:hypothetical protein
VALESLGEKAMTTASQGQGLRRSLWVNRGGLHPPINNLWRNSRVGLCPADEGSRIRHCFAESGCVGVCGEEGYDHCSAGS